MDPAANLGTLVWVLVVPLSSVLSTSVPYESCQFWPHTFRHLV